MVVPTKEIDVISQRFGGGTYRTQFYSEFLRLLTLPVVTLGLEMKPNYESNAHVSQ